MRRSSLLPMLAALGLAACDGSGAAQADAAPLPGTVAGAATPDGGLRFPLAGFDRVAVRGPDNVKVMVGPAFAVSARGDRAALDALELAVVDGELRIGRKQGRQWREEEAAEVRVSLPALRAAAVAGSGDLDIDRVRATAFMASVAGSGDMRIAALETPNAEISVAGSGDLRVAGKARKLQVALAGSGNVDAGALASDSLMVALAGSGDVAARTRGEASISILGSGDVSIAGTTRCQVSKVGSGTARCG